jgi:hypothetical protein
MRKRVDDMGQDPWSIPKKSPEGPKTFNDLNDSYTADFRPQQASNKK